MLVTNQKTILVTGGAGYIGSVTVLFLLQKNFKVIVIDKSLPKSKFFNKSKKFNQENYKKAKFDQETEINLDNKNLNNNLGNNLIFIQSDYANREILDYIFKSFCINTVLHLAAFIESGLSVKDPKIFYQNNISKTIDLFDCMLKNNINKIVFASSAAVYGANYSGFLTEELEKNPLSPYGKTKYFVENILQDYVHAYGLNIIGLRYFNASGALPDFDLGEKHNPETHLVPLILSASYNKKLFYIFGVDYNTPDGTCIRDYVHVYDIAQANYLSVNYLDNINNQNICEFINIGSGSGNSVKDIISVTQKITRSKIDINKADKRTGDPDILVADINKAKKILNFDPKFSSIDKIILSSHKYYKY